MSLLTIILLFLLLGCIIIILLLATVTYNQGQSFQINDHVNHNVDIEITGYRELYSINCKQQCLHVYNIYVCVCVCVLLISQEFMLVIITAQTYCKQSH